MMKKKLLLFIFISVVTVGIVLLVTTCSSENTKIKLGAIIALSGPASNHIDVKDGMLLAIDEINERGGINGKKTPT